MKHPRHIWVEAEGSKHLVKGRNAWALLKLKEAGERGVTPKSEPTGPRWSAYVFKLREAGFDIETVTEAHTGPYPGTHARYVLHTECRVLSEVFA